MLEISSLTPEIAERVRQVRWLITGAAGFIGSNVLEVLLRFGCEVKGFDNFEAGHRANLDAVKKTVGERAWSRFVMIEGDIRDFDTCLLACEKVDVVIHLAALGSVPSSLRHPNVTTDTNVGGFVNMLTAAKDSGVGRLVYASSCAVYGDDETLPKKEDHNAQPLSPYALSKLINEQYAAMFSQCYDLETIGLRFFNIYGPRQDPAAPYAAVIPIWTSLMMRGEPLVVNGDGETTRDFCHVSEVARACLVAGTIERSEAVNCVYNIGSGVQTSLNALIAGIAQSIRRCNPGLELNPEVRYQDFRPGDIRHSVADVSRARDLLGFESLVSIEEGLATVAGDFTVTRPSRDVVRKVGIVARGSAADGLGHFMRARAVTGALRDEGAEVMVLLRGESSGVALFQHSGLPFLHCENDEDAAAYLASWNPSVIVFDTLSFAADAFSAIAELGPTVSLSPVFDRLDQVDHLFHRTVHENPEWGTKARFPTIHKGLEYSIVSERCKHVPRPLYQHHLRQSPLSIAISMGGSDAPNRTLEILQALAGAECSLLIWVLLGEAYAHSYESLVTSVRGSRHEVILVKSNESMWRVLQSCCLIVCSGGMTTYEAAFAGLPSLNLPLHGDRQYLLAELEGRGACRVMAGDLEGMSKAVTQIEHWERNRGELLNMHDAAATTIPPHGATRVARSILALASAR